jgi:hypothetical protein
LPEVVRRGLEPWLRWSHHFGSPPRGGSLCGDRLDGLRVDRVSPKGRKMSQIINPLTATAFDHVNLPHAAGAPVYAPPLPQ